MKTEFKVNEIVWDKLLKRFDSISEILIHINYNGSEISYKLCNHTTWVNASEIEKENKTITFEQFQSLIHKLEHSQTANAESLWKEIKSAQNVVGLDLRKTLHLDSNVASATTN